MSLLLLPAPDYIGQPAGALDRPLIFSSGMSRRADFVPALRANHSIGIDICEMSPAAMAELGRELEASSAYLFVDSGAFAAFRAGLRHGKPTSLDFARVFAKFDALAEAIARADDSGAANDRVFYVMPDVVGDQVATLRALAANAESVRDYDHFAQAIFPLQRGVMSLAAFYDQVCTIVGGDMLTVGIPSAEEAVSNAELLELLTTRPDVYGVHILGAAHVQRSSERLQVLRDAGFDAHLSLDANRLRSYWRHPHCTRDEARERLLAGLPPIQRRAA